MMRKYLRSRLVRSLSTAVDPAAFTKGLSKYFKYDQYVDRFLKLEPTYSPEHTQLLLVHSTPKVTELVNPKNSSDTVRII